MAEGEEEEKRVLKIAGSRSSHFEVRGKATAGAKFRLALNIVITHTSSKFVVIRVKPFGSLCLPLPLSFSTRAYKLSTRVTFECRSQ
jgi:hypothetical protein